jgi:Arc/MetJ-type ribon-helix-helix transcriptional regulator
MTSGADERKHTTVSIPIALFEKIKKRIEGTGFTSVSSFVVYVLRELVSEKPKPTDIKGPFSKDDEERIKERLRGLGYV